jgi:antitoxin component of RelBE/YafQ-DinJ toxin-antitoxin module
VAGDDDTSAKIEALNAELAEVEIKAADGDNMYLVRAKFLRSKLASLTAPKPETAALPQALRMAALNTAHTDAKAKSEEKSTQKNLEGSTQVTVVYSKLEYASGVVPQLAGALPHAPHLPKRPKRTREGTKDASLRLRLAADMKAAFEAKCAAMEIDPSANVRALIAEYLSIPLDEAKMQKSREMQEAIAVLATEAKYQGNNINQLTKAMHEGKPSPLTPAQISQLLQDHRATVSAIIKLGSPG